MKEVYKFLSCFIMILSIGSCSRNTLDIKNDVIDLKGETIVISDPIIYKNKNGLRITNGVIDLNNMKIGLLIENSNDVLIDHIEFVNGEMALNYMTVRNCYNLQIDNCIFSNLGNGTSNVRALVVNNSPKTTISNNYFSKINASKVSRAIKVSDRPKGKPSRDIDIYGNKIEDIYPLKDADGIYVESPKHINLNMEIFDNQFKNNAKRFLKLNASGITIKNNTGSSTLPEAMNSFISIFGNNINILSNIFEGEEAGAFEGIAIGNLGIDEIKNITIDSNRIVNKRSRKGMKSSAVKFNSDTEQIKIQGNYFSGFKNTISTSFKKKNSIMNLEIRGNTLNTEIGIELFGDSNEILFEDNIISESIKKTMVRDYKNNGSRISKRRNTTKKN